MKRLAAFAAACLVFLAPTAASAAVPADYSVKGIDISHHQGTVNWPAVAGTGQQFAYLKATEGTDYADPTFGTNYAGAKGNGLYAGAYHYGLPDHSSGRVQADWFLDHARYQHDGRTLPPMLDIEWPSGPSGSPSPCYGMSPSAIVGWIRDFVDRVRERTGATTVIYTNTNWWNPCTGSNTSFGALPLFVADYSYGSEGPSPMPAGWSRWTFWQYTSGGSVSGISGNVDRDVFNGSAAALKTLVGGRQPVNDFDGDGASDLALFRPNAGNWHVKSVSRMVQLYGSYEYGGGGDIPLSGDFDGDGYTDIALYRPAQGQWWIKSVKRDVQLYAAYEYGGNGDIPLTGDFDGDGYTDIAVFRPSTAQWHIKSVKRNVQITGSHQWGGGGDIPLSGDFDGDGTDDMVLYRPAQGQWWVKSISRNVQLYGGHEYGGSGDVPMTGDFDGDGNADIALYRPSAGQWHVKSLKRGVQLWGSHQYGGSGDVPLTGDYDGDGFADIALYRPSAGQWHVKSLHRNAQLVGSHPYGGGGDVPATAVPTR
ncbi:hypothetical protein Val02_20540 [Virgisporangium aliadipatigenens]|uniref:Lysozyme n=1 Tax=Virgisporangium aliadipatigenens TaxID=741659 RepID=A0A8J3YJA4_9ACTN|nr:GH25 family lysozyme [Virgisporangium aliadipatigenens]GIJ45168.1 hypothetical protein Val02_20540 [Virgisporangium aliadipatigenens]